MTIQISDQPIEQNPGRLTPASKLVFGLFSGNQDLTRLTSEVFDLSEEVAREVCVKGLWKFLIEKPYVIERAALEMARLTGLTAKALILSDEISEGNFDEAHRLTEELSARYNETLDDIDSLGSPGA